MAIRKNTTEGATKNFEADFSTTDKFFHFLSTASIMNAFQKYFSYTRGICVCGIQNVHMGGTLEDWERLIQKVQNIVQYDVNGALKKYVKDLTPVLEQFVETYKGKPHL